MKNLKQILSALFISLSCFLFSCADYGEKRNGPPPDTFRHDPPMKPPTELDVIRKEIDSMHKAYLFDSTTRALAAADSNNQKTITKSLNTTIKISGSVWYALPYCGGMMPSKEKLDELSKLKQLPNAILILKSKSGEKFQIETSSTGKFTTEIPEGNYDVYLTENVGGVWNVSADECKNCLTEPITKINLTITGKNKIEFSFRCGPIPRP